MKRTVPGAKQEDKRITKCKALVGDVLRDEMMEKKLPFKRWAPTLQNGTVFIRLYFTRKLKRREQGKPPPTFMNYPVICCFAR